MSQVIEIGLLFGFVFLFCVNVFSLFSLSPLYFFSNPFTRRIFQPRRKKNRSYPTVPILPQSCVSTSNALLEPVRYTV
jgi:hypothetical protein